MAETTTNAPPLAKAEGFLPGGAPLPIQVSNTLDGKKGPLEPVAPPKVGIYACGVTVYDEAHMGHALQAVAFDVIRRFLTVAGYDVTYVRNYTDVDDKILARAREKGQDPHALAQHFVDDTEEVMARLKVRPPNHAPKVTDHMADIVALIQRLVDKGAAYERDGSVYFDVTAFETYGKLSGQDLDTLREMAPEEFGKDDPVDFALWKKHQEGEGMRWDSPWGPGRPGWHIECSAMSMKYLGDSFDIHGGGVDLVFPHHENEIAQSEAASGKPYVKYWLHNGLVTVGGTKMSKSLGNFLSIRQALDKYPPVVLRYAMLDHHFSSQADFGECVLLAATKRIYYFHRTVQAAADRLGQPFSPYATPDAGWPESAKSYYERFLKVMQDNFNTASAIVVLGDLTTELNKLLTQPKWNEEQQAQAGALVKVAGAMNQVLDILEDPQSLVGALQNRLLADKDTTAEAVDALVKERGEARANKDYAKADEVRHQLTALGVKVLDHKDGTSTWLVDPGACAE